MTDSTWHELALNTAMVMHVEQITPGSAACDCSYCGADAVMLITSEPDMEPGPVCAEHAWDWLDITLAVLGQLFPRP